MLEDILFRVIVGGLFVSLFALLGELLEPKRFAGLFGAAPSVALATLALTARTQGNSYAAIEARSMVGGAIAFLIYSCFVCHVMIRTTQSALVVTLISLPLWAAASFGLWFTWLR
jgi:hypothetical protein